MACRQENLLGLAWHKILELGWGLNTMMSINEHQVAGCWKTFSRVLKALGSKWNSYSHWRINYVCNFVSPSMLMAATRMVSGIWFSQLYSAFGGQDHMFTMPTGFPNLIIWGREDWGSQHYRGFSLSTTGEKWMFMTVRWACSNGAKCFESLLLRELFYSDHRSCSKVIRLCREWMQSPLAGVLSKCWCLVVYSYDNYMLCCSYIIA